MKKLFLGAFGNDIVSHKVSLYLLIYVFNEYTLKLSWKYSLEASDRKKMWVLSNVVGPQEGMRALEQNFRLSGWVTGPQVELQALQRVLDPQRE